MTDLVVPSIEDAVIRVSTAKERISKVVVETYRSTFLAFNTARGYSEVDFRHPSHRKIRELGAMLEVYCDVEQTERFYAGLYLDMIRLVNPTVEVVFTKEVAASPPDTSSAPGSRSNHSAPPAPLPIEEREELPARAAKTLLRRFGNARRARSELPRPPPARTAAPSTRSAVVSGPSPDHVQVAPEGTTLVAFGDSNTFGTELSEIELGRDDADYRDQRAYPRLLARELGVHFGGNLAETGRSNPKILRRVCDFVTNHRHELDRCFLVIGLTHPSRKAFVLKNGWEYLFVNRDSGMEPWVLKALCCELFYPSHPDPRMNEELSHKFWVLSSFLKAVGCRHVIFPCWDFAYSGAFFRARELSREGLFYFGPNSDRFGLRGVVRHLPKGPTFHPLSEAHAHFACVLGSAIRERGLL